MRGERSSSSPRPVAPPVPDGKPFGRYRLLSVLGAGGMGVVWKAEDTQLGRVVALKQIRPEAIDRETEQRFRREAQLSAKVAHPGIVAVHDVGETDGIPYLTMEFVKGTPWNRRLEESREARLARGGALREAVDVLAGVAEAVAAAHGQGILHRDLKPGNVLIDEAGRPRVTDFGLAKELAPPEGPAALTQAKGLTISGQVVGTPAYMSPEQAASSLETVGPGTDVWSLGVMLYEVLTGRLPYDFASPWDAVHAVSTREPVPVLDRHAAASAELAAVCMRTLVREPARRLPSAREFAAELRRWLRGEPVRSRPVGRLERLGRRLRRHRVAAGSTALVALLTLLGAAWAWRERGIRAQRSKELQEVLSRSVLGYQDQVMRHSMGAEAARALAEQPLALVDQVLDERPDFGPAHAWRGMLLHFLAREDEARSELDLACDRSPSSPVVWFLRAWYRLENYTRLRGIPAMTMESGKLRVDAADESEVQTALRTGALGDLARMHELPRGQGDLTDAEERIACAFASLASGRAEGYRQVFGQVAGIRDPRAMRIRAFAAYFLQRFSDAEAACGEVLEEWSADSLARRFRGLARYFAAMEAERRGGDGRPGFRAALEDLEQAQGDTDERAARTTHACVLVGLADAEAARGTDPRPLLKRAVDQMGELRAQDPGDVRVLGNLADTLVSLADAESRWGSDPRPFCRDALACAQEAVQRDPDSPHAQARRARAFRRLAEAEAAGGEDARPTFRAALADYDRLLAQEHATPVQRADRGTLKLLLAMAEAAVGGEVDPLFADALADCDDAQQADPACFAAFKNRALIRLEMSRRLASRGADPGETLSAGLADADEALRLSPGDIETRINRGSLWRESANAAVVRARKPDEAWQHALEDFDAVLARDAGNLIALVNRGSVRWEQANRLLASGGDPRPALDLALADYAAALARQPALAEAHAGLAQARSGLADVEERAGRDPRELRQQSLAALDEALRLNPALAVARIHRAEVQRALGRTEEERGGDGRPRLLAAVADLDEVLRRDPRSGRARNSRGIVRTMLGMAQLARGEPADEALRQAEEDLQAAITAGNQLARLNHGLLLRRLGRWDEAIAEFRSGAAAVPAHAEWAKQRIAETEAMRNDGPDWTDAIRVADRLAAERDPRGALAWYERGLAKLAQAADRLSPADRAATFADEGLRAGLARIQYAVACLHGRLGESDAAFAALEAAREQGFRETERARAEPDLAGLRVDPRWDAWLAKLPGR